MALALAAALARPGFKRKTKVMGLFRLGELPPVRPTEGIAQRCITHVPAECPRGCAGGTIMQPVCRACGEPTEGRVQCPACGVGDHFDRRVWCRGCGWDSYLVR